ncbi:MAG: ferredoxin [Saprospiraceae bacterium]
MESIASKSITSTDMIQLDIISNSTTHSLLVPNDVGINLMELLKSEAYDSIEGTCGGMALCATCHIRVKSSIPTLAEPSNDELDMLESLPAIYENSRLGCQIKLNDKVQQLTIEIIKSD